MSYTVRELLEAHDEITYDPKNHKESFKLSKQADKETENLKLHPDDNEIRKFAVFSHKKARDSHEAAKNDLEKTRKTFSSESILRGIEHHKLKMKYHASLAKDIERN